MFARNLIITFILVLVLCWLPTACSSSFAPPEPSILEAAPLQVTVAGLFNEFKNNAEQAGSVYTGKSLYFKSVEVESIKPATRNDPSAFFVSEKLMFKPRYIFDLDPVTQGTLVDVIGKVQGYIPDTVLVISDCWVKVVGGAVPTTAPVY